MRKKLLLGIAVAFSVGAMAQIPAMKSNHLKDLSSPRGEVVKFGEAKLFESSFSEFTPLAADEVELGGTRYDLQTNTCTPNRIFIYDDGAIGATWTMGLNSPGYGDRGTGYNYYDGATWGDIPTERIETVRSGWSSYAPWGATGEINVAHTDLDGIVINMRSVKGEGDWTEVILPGPAGAVDASWPRVMTSGPNREVIHVIYTTYSAYQGLDLALLYSRSNDGGQTWEVQNEILDGMTSTDYTGFKGDTYGFVESAGDKIAFIVADSWVDMFYMESLDNGATWEKHVIWEHPYPMYNNTVTDTFYCPDGSFSGVYDATGKLHVAFGINRANGDADGEYWYPFIGGIGYWNEDIPTWTGLSLEEQLEALNPELLETTNQLIGHEIDIDGNGTWDILEGGTEVLGTYYLGSSSMPQLAVGDDNDLYLVYSSVTEGLDNTTQNYRHIWFNSSMDNGETWTNAFVDITGGFLHAFDECIFPSMNAKVVDHAIHFTYQADEEPGLSIRGDEDPATDNKIYYASYSDGVGVEEQVMNQKAQIVVYPNPAMTTVNVKLDVNAENIELLNTFGQLVASYQCDNRSNMISFNVENLATGIYFIKVDADGEQIIHKVVIR